ncbi:MAG: hypothetical protein LBT47_12090 [Deltaproteobacteria bacterium]|jgi:hypothetical protein|nr:hypothetical protein [Deltaproteobacteria bacterium]
MKKSLALGLLLTMAILIFSDQICHARPKNLTSKTRVALLSCLAADDNYFTVIESFEYFTWKEAADGCFSGLIPSDSTKEQGIQEELIESLANLPFDQRGVWDEVGNKIESSLTEFRHFNPAIITWLERNFILLTKDPGDYDFQVRQKIYEKYRDSILIKAYAWQYLNRYHDIALEAKKYEAAAKGTHKDQMLYYLAQFAPEPEQNYDLELEKIYSWGQAEYPDEIYAFRFDVGFWLRRELDGTAKKLATLLETTMRTYDPEFKQQDFFSK